MNYYYFMYFFDICSFTQEYLQYITRNLQILQLDQNTRKEKIYTKIVVIHISLLYHNIKLIN